MVTRGGFGKFSEDFSLFISAMAYMDFPIKFTYPKKHGAASSETGRLTAARGGLRGFRFPGTRRPIFDQEILKF